MLLKTTILHETHVCTISMLEIDNVFFGFICEDGFRQTKVPDETRIPGGRFQIIQARTGKFFTNYKRRFGHEWVPCLVNVPGFSGILIHIGNGPDDSRGCMLVGRSWGYTGNSHYVGDSTETYKKLYDTLNAAFNRKEEVWIEVDRTALKDRIAIGKPAPTVHTAATIL